MKKISVIVPIYNKEKYLSTCIDSIVNQTLDNIEIILVDDGSTDNSCNICDEYSKKCSNVNVYHIQNSGVSNARNFGISHAHGEYIGFVDADDFVLPEMYEILYKLVKDNNADLAMCEIKSITNNFESNLHLNLKNKYINNKEVVNELIRACSEPGHYGLHSVCNKIFSSEIIHSKHLRFDSKLNKAEDAWFVFYYLKISNCVCVENQAFYVYRQVENSITHTFDYNEYQNNNIYHQKLLNEMNSLNINVDLNNFYSGYLINSILYCKEMYKVRDFEKLDLVLKDNYFIQTCNYSKMLPKHYKIICFLIKHNLKLSTKFAIMIWCFLK